MSYQVKTEPSTPASLPSASSSSSSFRAPPSSRSFQPAKVEASPPELDEQGNANYSEYRLVSNGKGGWSYNIIKFNSNPNKPEAFNPLDLPQPALLNRKDPRPRPPPPPPVLDEHGNPVEEFKPVLDINGKPMIGPDGKVMLATGKKGPGADMSLIAPDGGAVKNKKNLFKKKTKQIFKVSQERMRLRREERHPWVLEGNPNVKQEEGAPTVPGETWVGRMEDTGDKSFVMFVFEDDKDEFNVVDVKRWYKFQQRPAYQTLNMDEAEEIYAKTMKGKDPRRWIMHSPTRANASLPSAPSSSNSVAGPSRIKVEDNLPSYLRRSAPSNGSGSGGGAGSSRVKEERMDWEDDGGEEGGARRRNEGGGDADADADFEDEFSDDDGQIEFDQADEAENKELEERIKREFRQDGTAPDANSADGSDEEDLFGDEALKGEGKAIKKVLKKNTRGDAYASDDENHNPYASSEESDSDSPPSPPPAPSQPSTLTSTGLHVPPPPPSRVPSTTNASSSSTRHSSPGASLLAQRATSPHRRHHSSSSSHNRSRSGSPSARSSPPPAASGSSSSNKRKSTPDVATGADEGGKKVRLATGAPAVKEREIINYIRRESPNIQQLIKHFKKSLKSTDPEITAANKAALIEVTKKVAIFAGGVITLKPEFE